MEIKNKIQQQVGRGKKVIEFTREASSIKLLVNNINRALKDLGYDHQQYKLTISGPTVKIELN